MWFLQNYRKITESKEKLTTILIKINLHLKESYFL